MSVSPYNWQSDEIFPWLSLRDGGYYLIPPAISDSVQFRLLQPLGKGGQGRVYLAVQTDERNTGHLVALKCFLPSGSDLLQQARLARMAIQERNRTNDLRDRGFVLVHSFGPDVISKTNQPLGWYSMDFIPGRTLSDLIQAWHRLPQSLAIKIAEEICRALVYLHEQPGTVIHRDLKPDNVKLDSSRQQSIVLLDLGLALNIFLPTPTASSVNHSIGSLLCGTTGYMAPERYNPGEPQSVQSDFWSLGAILYEMLTGQKALTCSSDWNQAKRETQTFTPKDPGQIVPDLDREIRQLSMRLMSSMATNRASSTRELLEELQQCRERVRSVKVTIDSQWTLLSNHVQNELDQLRNAEGESIFQVTRLLHDSSARDQFRDTISLWNSLASARVQLQFTEEQCVNRILQDVAQSSLRLKEHFEVARSVRLGSNDLEQNHKDLDIAVTQLGNSVNDLKQLFTTSMRPFQTILLARQSSSLGIGTNQALISAREKFRAISQMLSNNNRDGDLATIASNEEYLETRLMSDIYACFEAIRVLDEAVLDWMSELSDTMIVLAEQAKA